MFDAAGTPVNDTEAWARVGITPMIGQNDVPGEVFTISDAEAVNAFARGKGVGLLSMWSANRDGTCQRPLPTVIAIVQSTCSGIDQGDKRFAEVLSANLGTPLPSVEVSATPSPSGKPGAATPSPTGTVDDPAHSPFPIWDPLGRYPGGTKVVWHHQVFMARYWTSGVAPDMPVANAGDSPWALVGPVLPGDPRPPCRPFPPAPIHSGTRPRRTPRARACRSSWCPTRRSGGRRDRPPARSSPAVRPGSWSHPAPDPGGGRHRPRRPAEAPPRDGQRQGLRDNRDIRDRANPRPPS